MKDQDPLMIRRQKYSLMWSVWCKFRLNTKQLQVWKVVVVGTRFYRAGAGAEFLAVHLSSVVPHRSPNSYIYSRSLLIDYE